MKLIYNAHNNEVVSDVSCNYQRAFQRIVKQSTRNSVYGIQSTCALIFLTIKHERSLLAGTENFIEVSVGSLMKFCLSVRPLKYDVLETLK